MVAGADVSIKRLAARRASWLISKLRLDQLIDGFNRSGGGCILCYHHISGPALEVQLSLLSQRYRIISLDEFVSRLEMDKDTAGLLAITFDDGFADEVENGSALAVERGWPMTFYLPTDFVSSGQPYWFEQIEPWLQAAPEGSYRVEGVRFHIDDRRSRSRAREVLVRHLFHRPAGEIGCFMGRLEEALFGSPGPPGNVLIPAPISWARVKELSGHDAVLFGAHSVSHSFLSTLTHEQIVREMEDSKEQVEQGTGRSTEHFCYPYGDRASIGALAPGIARRIFRSATTIMRGRCHRNADPFMLPRIALFEHDTEAMAGLRVGRAR